MSFAATDVVVVGGGLIGAATARALARQGLSITLLEAGPFGREASYASAGMLAPGGEYQQPSHWAAMAVASLRRYESWVEALREESGLPIDYRRCGAMELAFTPEQLTALELRAGHQRRAEIPSERFTREDARDLAPGLDTTTLLGGLFYPEDALVNPRDLLAALRISCERAGVRLLVRHPVQSITISHDELTVIHSGGCLSARAAVLAAGAWSNQVQVTDHCAPASLVPAVPVKGHLVQYNGLGRQLTTIVRHASFYAFQRKGGEMIVGATASRGTFEKRVEEPAVRSLHEQTRLLIPITRHRPRPDDAWTGLRPATDRDEPVVTRHGGTNLWLAYGHYRNGVLLAPVTADTIADEVIANWGRE